MRKNHAHCLKVCVNNCRTHEFHAALFQVFRDGIGKRGSSFPCLPDHLPSGTDPQIFSSFLFYSCCTVYSTLLLFQIGVMSTSDVISCHVPRLYFSDVSHGPGAGVLNPHWTYSGQWNASIPAKEDFTVLCFRFAEISGFLNTKRTFNRLHTTLFSGKDIQSAISPWKIFPDTRIISLLWYPPAVNVHISVHYSWFRGIIFQRTPFFLPYQLVISFRITRQPDQNHHQQPSSWFPQEKVFRYHDYFTIR